MTNLSVRSVSSAIRPAGLVLACLALVLPWFVEFPGLSDVGSRMFGIFLMAIVLWVTEAIPLHATAALIVLLEILLVSDKAFGVESISDPPPFATFFAAFAHPVIMLFLGGFFIAVGAAKFSAFSRRNGKPGYRGRILSGGRSNEASSSASGAGSRAVPD